MKDCSLLELNIIASQRLRAHVFLAYLGKPALCSILSQIVGVKTHVLGVGVSLHLHIRSNIFEFEFTFTAVRANRFEGFYCALPLHDFIHAEVAHIVHAALTKEHAVKVSQANGTVVFEVMSLLSILREKIATFDVF